MSEKKGPFDLTLRILRKESIQLRPFKTDIDSAIRVLEAAGRVDKAICLAWLEKAFVDIDDIPEKEQLAWLTPGNRKVQIRALLETLPEPAQNTETDNATFMGMDKATELVKEKIETLPEKEKK